MKQQPGSPPIIGLHTSNVVFNPKKYVNAKVTLQEVIAAKESFDLLDEDNAGMLQMRDVRILMRKMGFNSVNSMFYEYDTDKVKFISFQEWLSLLTERYLNKKSMENLGSIFWLFDKQRTGFISFKDLKRVASELGEEISDGQLKEMLKTAGKYKEGHVSQYQFYEIMSRDIGL